MGTLAELAKPQYNLLGRYPGSLLVNRHFAKSLAMLSMSTDADSEYLGVPFTAQCNAVSIPHRKYCDWYIHTHSWLVCIYCMCLCTLHLVPSSCTLCQPVTLTEKVDLVCFSKYLLASCTASICVHAHMHICM